MAMMRAQSFRKPVVVHLFATSTMQHFFGSSSTSRQFRALHEALKAAHRTRAFGWSGQLVAIIILEAGAFCDGLVGDLPATLSQVLERFQTS
jgi:hypothetical protein